MMREIRFENNPYAVWYGASVRTLLPELLGLSLNPLLSPDTLAIIKNAERAAPWRPFRRISVPCC